MNFPHTWECPNCLATNHGEQCLVCKRRKKQTLSPNKESPMQYPPRLFAHLKLTSDSTAEISVNAFKQGKNQKEYLSIQEHLALLAAARAEERAWALLEAASYMHRFTTEVNISNAIFEELKNKAAQAREGREPEGGDGGV